MPPVVTAQPDRKPIYEPNEKPKKVTPGGQLGPQPVGKEGMKTLVLDLDETLVHSAFKEPPKFDIKLPVSISDRDFIVYVQIRPGCF